MIVENLDHKYISSYKNPKLLSSNVNFIEDFLLRENDRTVFFVTLGGSYMHGFESEKSDMDFRAVHFSDSSKYLSLHSPEGKVLEAELDNNIGLVSYDLGSYVSQLLKMNCNMLEQLFAASIVYINPLYERQFYELRMYIQNMLSKKGMFDSYHGLMTHNYKKYIINDNHVTNKKFLYIIKNGLSLQYALGMRRIEPNINKIMEDNLGIYCHYTFEEQEMIKELVRRKRYGLGDDVLTIEKDQLDQLVSRMFTVNHICSNASFLQDRPTDFQKRLLDEWLVEFRLHT